jgi:hypothetical protein
MNKFKFISDELGVLAVPYEFGEWTKEVKYPYFVGEINETATMTEDGYEESTMLLTGFTRGKYIDLEIIKEKIKSHFNPITGMCAKTDSGSIAVFFNGSNFIPTNEAELKRIQINLLIKEWKGSV